ncbi:hypothetical protein GLOIN_2v1567959 [Rhizophagus irregularis DAOM 181602=DAOM 197198]|uniref:Uncharacterized protein n=1 Tax=Rhizophagus irregularis (strain DAOM 181602 / DAOM 197198 / MUCL 43194) TaxID=747089 RepID=A0A2P4QC53_RHIID|nr:hypothetical protein GLOIN_2v1567959 [Rhizophagus irregularis DAOM 181602=DAOM 197198]POG75220.1 hypothetical protein GLOIN_2v1567959 [Rhizophagus irregularis DAOM 181602=DAOM 197198]|eukprot:XP_025182086.1 hypothetical protein GLOIN_2v1567959 [Rhizophagus irregularis DAOM 181602=DAOM 197198]
MIQNFGYYNNNMHFPSYDWRLSFYNRRLEINGFLSSRTSKKKSMEGKMHSMSRSLFYFFIYY